MTARFIVDTVVDAGLTVVDTERERHIVHEVPWDQEMADAVAASLEQAPNYVRCWDWESLKAVVA